MVGDRGTVVHVAQPKSGDCMKKQANGRLQHASMNCVVQVLGKVYLSRRVNSNDVITLEKAAN